MTNRCSIFLSVSLSGEWTSEIDRASIMSVIVNKIELIEQVLSAEVQHAYSGCEVKWLGKNGPFVKVDHHMYCLSKLSAAS
jgi:hypothetical protein